MEAYARPVLQAASSVCISPATMFVSLRRYSADADARLVFRAARPAHTPHAECALQANPLLAHLRPMHFGRVS